MKTPNNSKSRHCEAQSIRSRSNLRAVPDSGRVGTAQPLTRLASRGELRLLQHRIMRFAMTVAVIFLISHSVFAADKVRIVATTNTLASLTHEITGDLAEIYHVAPPRQNIHFIQPTPRDVLKIKKAQAFVHGGLDLEVWRDSLLVAAGNPLFLGEAKAAVNVSKGIPLIEVPTSLSRVQGDIHAYGNPHYAIDPDNAKIIMNNIVEGLSHIFPGYAGDFTARARAWEGSMNQKLKEWNQRMNPYRGTAVVTYHRSWPYFTNRFGLTVVGEVEPKPGIPPTPKHISDLIQLMKEKGVKLIIKESFNERSTPNRLAKETGAVVVTLDQDVGESDGVADYISMIDHNIQLIEEALK